MKYILGSLVLIFNIVTFANSIPDDAFYDRLKNNWIQLLRESSTTTNIVQFIDQHKIAIQIEPQLGNSILGSFYAEFRNDIIYFNQALINEAYAELSSQGFSAQALEDLLAKKTADLIVHELTHAQIEEQILKEQNLRLNLPLQEDEILAYSAQARSLNEFQDPFTLMDFHISALQDMQLQLSQAGYSGGCNEIQLYIKKWNPVISILSSQSDVLRSLNTYMKDINSGLTLIEKRLHELTSGAQPGGGMTKEEELQKLKNNKTSMTANKNFLQENILILSDENNFLRLQDFYRARIKPLSCSK